LYIPIKILYYITQTSNPTTIRIDQPIQLKCQYQVEKAKKRVQIESITLGITITKFVREDPWLWMSILNRKNYIVRASPPLGSKAGSPNAL